MAGYDRPTGGYDFSFAGINTTDAPDQITPDQYPLAKNVRALADRSIITRPGYALYSTNVFITTSCPITIANEGVAYSFTLTATGGTLPYTWTIVAGALPGGLTLHAATGVIDGTPTEQGYFTFTIRVTDALGNSATQDCSIFVNPECNTSDWTGCLAGSFNNAGDWVTYSAGAMGISSGQAFCNGVGFIRNHLGGCGSSLNQEVYLVYNTKTAHAGNRGYYNVGPGCRMTGSATSVATGYFFTVQMWGGTGGTGAPCFYSSVIGLEIQKVVAGVITSLASISIVGTDLTEGTPIGMTCVVEGGGARIKGFLGGTEELSVLDSTAVLPTGEVGVGCPQGCSGNPPTPIFFDFIKARNL